MDDNRKDTLKINAYRLGDRRVNFTQKQKQKSLGNISKQRGSRREIEGNIGK